VANPASTSNTASAEQESSFLRVLGRADVISLAFGCMIGWGWVVLSGTWVLSAGTLGGILAFLIGGGAIALVGLTYAELASALPFAGGEHVYSERALGRTHSFICTWAIILGYMSVIAFEAVALPTVASSLLPGLDQIYLWTIAGWDVYLTWVMVGISGAVLMTVLNVLGVKMVAIVQTVVVAMILVMGSLFVLGAGTNGSAANLEPLFIDGLSGIAVVLVMVPFMFVGFDVIPQAAEEIDLPFRDIGSALVLSVVLAIAWYALIIFGVALVAEDRAVLASEVPTAEAAGVIFGPTGRLALLITGLAGIITSWNALIVGASRAIYALANAGMLPSSLGRLHPRYRTPANAVILLGVLSIISPFFGRPALVWLVNAGGLGVVVAYIFVTWSFLALRKNEPDLPRPYTVPWGRTVGRAALLLAIGMVFLYLPGSPSALIWPQEWGIILCWVVLGCLLFTLARREQ
jgi:amino acid transporter